MRNSLYRRHAQSLDRWAGGGNGRTAMARVLGTIGALKSARDRALPARPREFAVATTLNKRLDADAPSRIRYLRHDRGRMSCVSADLSWRRRPRG
jgi:hypothetical protein